MLSFEAKYNQIYFDEILVYDPQRQSPMKFLLLIFGALIKCTLITRSPYLSKLTPAEKQLSPIQKFQYLLDVLRQYNHVEVSIVHLISYHRALKTYNLEESLDSEIDRIIDDGFLELIDPLEMAKFQIVLGDGSLYYRNEYRFSPVLFEENRYQMTVYGFYVLLLKRINESSLRFFFLRRKIGKRLDKAIFLCHLDKRLAVQKKQLDYFDYVY